MFELSTEKITEAMQKTSYNYKIAEYYQTLYMMTDQEKYKNKCMYISSCYKYFDIDLYKQQQISDITSISLCHDKFCKNCQNLLSKQRYIHFKPFLDELSEEYDLYHVILTVPNVPGWYLKQTLDQMYDSFAKFIKIFRRKNTKYEYLNLTELGYRGAVRSLEITYSDETGFHPHFHCIFAINKELDLQATTVNRFSYDKGVFVKKFTDFEITIQKLWYLIYNGIRVTEEHFIEAPGYSCIAELTNYDYKEVFKYTLKETFDSIMNSELIFLQVEQALRNRRIIQGYGCLFGISDSAEEQIAQEADKLYLKHIAELTKIEDPLHLQVNNQMLKDEIELNPDMKFMSRSSIKGVINYDEEE